MQAVTTKIAPNSISNSDFARNISLLKYVWWHVGWCSPVAPGGSKALSLSMFWGELKPCVTCSRVWFRWIDSIHFRFERQLNPTEILMSFSYGRLAWYNSEPGWNGSWKRVAGRSDGKDCCLRFRCLRHSGTNTDGSSDTVRFSKEYVEVFRGEFEYARNFLTSRVQLHFYHVCFPASSLKTINMKVNFNWNKN